MKQTKKTQEYKEGKKKHNRSLSHKQLSSIFFLFCFLLGEKVYDQLLD